MNDDRRGAYGLALLDLAGRQWLNPAPAEWPEWRFIEQRESPSPPPEPAPGFAVVRGDGERSELIDRQAATTTLIGGAPLPAHALVHPVLGTTAAAVAHWRGMVTFHAGAFLAPDGGAWGVLGDRERGKSSVLAWLAREGHEVVADDLLITDGERVLAGPRCIDLREGAARALGMGTELGLDGIRWRWRVDLPPIAAETPLRGWVSLRWDERVGVVTTEPRERARWLGAAVGLQLAEQPPLPWLGALAKPMIELSRPRSWETLDGTMARLLECVAAAYR